MCGIVGIMSKSKYGLTNDHVTIFNQLLYVGALRGEDSTGIIYVEREGHFAILKEACHSAWAEYSLLGHDLLKRVVIDGRALIGHNRKATVGKIVSRNAHPFVVDDTFAMVHNGSLHRHHELANTEVDSEALAQHLKPYLTGTVNMEGLAEALDKVYGAYAVVIYDQVGHNLHFLRNSLRPLTIIETDSAWAWASEKEMVEWILTRNNVTKSRQTVVGVETRKLYTISLEECKLTVQEIPEVKKASPQITSKTTTGTGTGGVGNSAPFRRAANSICSIDLSKNEFKRLKRKFLYERVTFYVDDYVEKGFPRTIEDGERDLYIIGEVDHPNLPENTARGEFTLPEGVGAEYLEDRLFSGRIVEMSYEGRGQPIIIGMDNIHAITKSNVCLLSSPKKVH